MTLVVRTTLFIGAVKEFEVVLTNVIASKDISDEFQDRGLPNTSLSNKKDGVWPIRPVFRCFDDPLLERLHVTRIYCYFKRIGGVAVDLLDRRDVILVGMGNVFIIRQDRPARAIDAVDGYRREG